MYMKLKMQAKELYEILYSNNSLVQDNSDYKESGHQCEICGRDSRVCDCDELKVEMEKNTEQINYWNMDRRENYNEIMRLRRLQRDLYNESR